MFIGHFGVAFAAKRMAPSLSLGTMFLCSQLVDLMWPLMLLLGVEHVRIHPGITVVTPLDFYDYPFTHSLTAFVLWSVLAGGLIFLARRQWKVALVAAGLVFSHWILDLVTHRPDLPLAPGSDVKMGLGLWNSLWATVIVEGAIFGVGVYGYGRMTASTGKTGSIALWSLGVFLVVVWLMNLFGPPPPSERAIAIIGNATWLLVLWGYWIDKKRSVVA